MSLIKKANSSSIIVLEGKTIAKRLCEVHSLVKQIWDPLKPWRLSSLSPTICGDCSKHLAGDLPHPAESQWECGREPAVARSTPLHFNYTVSWWLASMSPHLLYVTMHSCQYLRSTSCGAETCHKPKHHEILPTTLNQVIFGPDRYGLAWDLFHQYLYQDLLMLYFVVYCWCISLTSDWGAGMFSMCLIIMHSVYRIDSLMYLRGSIESWGRLVQQTFKGSQKALTMSAVCKDLQLN